MSFDPLSSIEGSKETVSLMQYLKSLQYTFPNEDFASTELINLSAVLALPKATEQFISDIHGEFEAFDFFLRSASGNVRKKIEKMWSFSLPKSQRNALAALIYYPEEKLPLLLEDIEEEEDRRELLCTLIYQVVVISRLISTKYTRSKVYKMLPDRFKYIMDELLNEQEKDKDKSRYYTAIIQSVVSVGQGPELIIALCHLIQKLAVDKLHIVGDVFDRGSGAHLCMNTLMQYHDVDIQWGNHDVLWLGACAGSLPCVACAVRISLRYMNLETLEVGYGINLLPLARMASEIYADDPCERFQPKVRRRMFDSSEDHHKFESDIKVTSSTSSSTSSSPYFTTGDEEDVDESGDEVMMRDVELVSKMQKAIAIIQFKLEGQLIERRHIFNMTNRNMLHRINFEDCQGPDPIITSTTVDSEGLTGPACSSKLSCEPKATSDLLYDPSQASSSSSTTKALTITLPNGSTHDLLDSNFPTVDPTDPYALTQEEKDVIQQLCYAFTHSPQLEKHCKFLMDKGSLYKCYNGALLFHGCVPLDTDGKLSEVTIPHISDITGKEEGITLKGKALYDTLERQLRDGFFLTNRSDDHLSASLEIVAPTSSFSFSQRARDAKEAHCKVEDSSCSVLTLEDNKRILKQYVKNRKDLGLDMFFWCWCSPKSPLFGRSHMATFEGHFIADKKAKKEIPDPFFSYRDDETVVDSIIADFEVPSMGGIKYVVTGHTPVKVKKGEQPMKAGGKMLCIDGGFSRAYQPTTGIAGFTLVCDSHELFLCQHKPFTGKKDVIHGKQVTSRLVKVTEFPERLMIKDTDDGHAITERIEALKKLMLAYQTGELKPIKKMRKKKLLKFKTHLGKRF
ncbi:Fructose-1,6-bisphosphatase class 3 [Aduncisulcus paluster]|uniref:Fructose-1,6-bisphosphatase class 3 n=1 Tax=Aduncisulcus paluster TaxID=2918883 RepID=A0ABQ5K2G8_9EUKA|nr:Fructose-1,6-bisphosphatase class 3 [Aduncisulcus paluster]